jgi:hypothetical protein
VCQRSDSFGLDKAQKVQRKQRSGSDPTEEKEKDMPLKS